MARRGLLWRTAAAMRYSEPVVDMPIVTFTTDFGFSDGYVGAMKGVVLSMAPEARLVDITHGIAPQDVAAGAIALAQAAPLFPRGTIHVAVVDPGVGGARADVVVASGGSFFIGPDNGVLSLAAPEPRQVYRIDATSFRREPVSPTVHGRDVFSPTAGRLAPLFPGRRLFPPGGGGVGGGRAPRGGGPAAAVAGRAGSAAGAPGGRSGRRPRHPRRPLRQSVDVADRRAGLVGRADRDH